ncbi:hypothetical protein ViNHUV68_01850 [Vibrio sp. NH-UV-68]
MQRITNNVLFNVQRSNRTMKSVFQAKLGMQLTLCRYTTKIGNTLTYKIFINSNDGKNHLIGNTAIEKKLD